MAVLSPYVKSRSQKYAICAPQMSNCPQSLGMHADTTISIFTPDVIPTGLGPQRPDKCSAANKKLA